MTELKFTFRQFLGVICIILWIIVLILVFKSQAYQETKELLIKQSQDYQKVQEKDYYFVGESIMASLGGVFYILGIITLFWVIFSWIGQCAFNKTKEEQEIEKETERIEKKYKLQKLERRIKKLKK